MRHVLQVEDQPKQEDPLVERMRRVFEIVKRDIRRERQRLNDERDPRRGEKPGNGHGNS